MRPQEQKGAVELGLHSSIADCQKKASLENCPVQEN